MRRSQKEHEMPDDKEAIQQNRECLVGHETELQFGLSQDKERGWNVQTLLLQHIRIFASFS